MTQRFDDLAARIGQGWTEDVQHVHDAAARVFSRELEADRGEADFIGPWIAATRSLRGEFEDPDRSPAREIDLV